MSIQRIFRSGLRSNFVLGALLAPAVACSGSNQASNNTVGSGLPDGSAPVDDSSSPVVLPVEPVQSSEASTSSATKSDGSGTPACILPDLECDAGCLTNDTLNCGACGNVCPSADGGTPTCTESNGTYACGLSCDSGFAACGGACVPTTFQTDENCGSCGHGCIGGPCNSGICGPWPVASGVEANNIVGANQPAPFGTDGVTVAYTSYVSGVSQYDDEVPLAGGTPANLGSNPAATGVAAISGSYAVFGAVDQGGEEATDSVLVPAVNGSQSQWIDTGSFNEVLAAVISEDHTTIYAQLGSFWGSPHTTGYVSCPFQAGASCSPIFAPPNQPKEDTVNGLAIDSNYLFVADITNGKILQYQLPSGPESTLATDTAIAPYVAVDSTYVYWVDSVSGTITVKRALQGAPSTPETLVTLSGTATGLAVGSSTVYVGGTTGSGSTLAGFVVYYPLTEAGGDAGAASPSGDAGSAAPVTVYQGNPVGWIAAGGGAVLWFDLTASSIYAERAP
jgi:hypothetical protein